MTFLIYFFIVLYIVLPMVSVFIASMIASANNCKLNEGSPQPCLISGRNIGPMLYQMFVAGWLMLWTIPTGLVALVVYTVILFFWR